MANDTITAISRSLVLTGALLAAWLLPGAAVCGQCTANELAKLTASDAAADDEFGLSVSSSGGVALIGARLDDDAGFDSGSAYVFRFDGTNYIEEAKLTASDAAPWDNFGWSVSVSSDVAVIGAWRDDDAGSASGSAYVYRFNGNTWEEEAKLTASDAAWGDEFGVSVSVSGNVAVIGAYLDDDACPGDPICNSGSVYVFRFDGITWIEEAKLTASDGAGGELFGSSVFVNGDMAVIGAYFDDDAGSASGSAYVYRFDGNTWEEQAKLTASDAVAEDLFGASVSISGDVAVIGAPDDDDRGNSSGSAYVFKRPKGGWVNTTETAKLSASDAAAGDQFGIAVSISGDMAVIGAWLNSDAGLASGSAYLFKKANSGWVNMTETAKLTASDAAAEDYFGFPVAIDVDVAVIGAHFDDDAGTNSGSAYIFGGLSDCNDNGTLDICDIADGTSRDANSKGIPDECECPWDVDGNGTVGILDLLALLAAWGADPGGPPDFDGDGTVGILDLLTLLANWGPC